MNDIIKKILTLKDDYNMIRVDDVYTDKWIGRHYGSTQPGRMGKKGYTEEEFDEVINSLKELIKYQKDLKNFIFYYNGERGPEYPEFERILKELKKEYPNSKFICIYNDWREFPDTEFTYIISLNYWIDVWHDNKENHENIVNIGNNHKRTKLFISKNRGDNISGSRRKWVDFMKKNNLLEDAHYSIGWEGKWLEDDVGESTTGMNGPDDYKVMDFYKDVFVEVVTESLIGYESIGHGYYNSEKLWRPFLMGVIPMIITFPNVNVHLTDMGFDMFDDVIDTSFYEYENFEKQFEIINKNLKIVKNDLVVDGRFREDIWDRLKNNQKHFLNQDSIENYLRKII